MKLRRYWFTFRTHPLPVVVLGRTYEWTGIYGIEIGRWFFGCVVGGPAKTNAEGV